MKRDGDGVMKFKKNKNEENEEGMERVEENWKDDSEDG